MTKLYIYTTVEGFQGNWDEALESGKVEVVAVIEGKDNKTVEAKAKELYGDQDTFGWTYSAEGIREAGEVEEIKHRVGGRKPLHHKKITRREKAMTRKEQLQHMEEKLQGDFWAAVEFLITEEAWGMSEFEEADIVDIFNGSFNNPVEENMDYLRNIVTMAEKAVKDDVAYQNMTQQDQEMGRYAERHEGISAFFSFLRDSLKDPSVLDSEAGRKEWVKDLENALATTGGNDYEIPGRLTKSGNAELYTIRREWFTAPDGEEDYLIVH